MRVHATFTAANGTLSDDYTSDSGHALLDWITSAQTPAVIQDGTLVTQGTLYRGLFDEQHDTPNVRITSRWSALGNIAGVIARTQFGETQRVGGFFNPSGNTLNLVERDAAEGIVGSDETLVIAAPSTLLLDLHLMGTLARLFYSADDGPLLLALEKEVTLLDTGYSGVSLFGTAGQVALTEFEARDIRFPTEDRPRRVDRSEDRLRRSIRASELRRRA